jgi:hypothetical protein
MEKERVATCSAI